jgi:hypothetical protein
MRIAAALLALTLASCTIPHRATQAFHIPRGGEIQIDLDPAADRAIVFVERGLVDVSFRGPLVNLRADLEAGQRRATCKRDGIQMVIVTARQPSLVTVQTD